MAWDWSILLEQNGADSPDFNGCEDTWLGFSLRYDCDQIIKDSIEKLVISQPRIESQWYLLKMAVHLKRERRLHSVYGCEEMFSGGPRLSWV